MERSSSKPDSMPIAVYALSVGAFGIGTTEFVVMGLLENVADSFRITIGMAGYVVTAYALGVVLGAPVITPLLARVPRRMALTGLMALFTLGNAACAAAPTLGLLLVARVVTAFAHASYFGIGSVVASDIAPPSKRSSAISAMFLGATIANVLGVPLGTLIGQEFGWRISFAAVAALGAIATITTFVFVPPTPNVDAERPSLRRELFELRKPAVVRALALTAFGFSGTFAVFTYIAPMLTSVAGIRASFVSPVLFLFGGGMIVGNAIGGRLADANTDRALKLTLSVLAIVLLSYTVTMANPISACFSVFVLGAAMFATIAPLQTHVIEVGRDAPTLAASCNIAAFNLGNAAGAWVGGLMIDHGFGLRTVPVAATILTGVGLVLSLVRSPKANGQSRESPRVPLSSL